jgi:hypothetical protein
MEHWYSMVLGNEMTASMISDEIEKAFLKSYISAGKPCDMAVFKRSESEGHLHCEVTAYFSPAAAEVARDFDAEPCGKPSRLGLSLLAGDEVSWSVLFLTREGDR